MNLLLCILYIYIYKRSFFCSKQDKLAKEAAQAMEKINQTTYIVGPTTDTVGKIVRLEQLDSKKKLKISK